MVYPHLYRTEHSETITTSSEYGSFTTSSSKNKIKIQPELLSILGYIDSHRVDFKNDLADAVGIKSCPSRLKFKADMLKMKVFCEKWLNKLGIKNESYHMGQYQVDGVQINIPPLILARLGSDPQKKTLLVYLFLDVPHPTVTQWDTDPWELTELDDRFFGMGTAQGKGPLMCWLHAIQAFQESKVEIPVNLKFVIEAMYTHESLALETFLAMKKQEFCYDVDCIVVSESEWIGQKYPCIAYGTVGMLSFSIIMKKNDESKAEMANDMKALFESFMDDNENILIPEFNKFVEQITPDEEKLYESIKGFEVQDLKDVLPSHKRKWDKVKLLMSFWRLPGMVFDEIENCICEEQDKSIIKRNFVIKIVPRQNVDDSAKLVKDFVEKTVQKLNIKHQVDCHLLSGVRPWKEHIGSSNYNAAKRATIQIYKEEPNMIREDRARELITILDRVLERNILLLPLVPQGSNISEGNENIPIRIFYEATKLIAAYLLQLAIVK